MGCNCYFFILIAIKWKINGKNQMPLFFFEHKIMADFNGILFFNANFMAF